MKSTSPSRYVGKQNVQLKCEHLGFGLVVLVGVSLLGAATITPYVPVPPESAGVSPRPFANLGGLPIVAGCEDWSGLD